MSSQSWQELLRVLTPLSRVHASPDMSRAYRLLQKNYPSSEILSVSSGEKSGYWTSPPEWQIHEAKLFSPEGEVIVDVADHPLHLYTYSPSIEAEVDLAELEKHLMSVPHRPDVIPFHFRNQYRFWEPEWGFCLQDEKRKKLRDGIYKVKIKTEFKPGKMEMLEQVHPGELRESILFVGHFDHPSMAIDGLIGCLAGHEVLRRLKAQKTKLSYRMLSCVEIIGSAFYVDRWAADRNVREALFLATAGARAPLVYQSSFRSRGIVDRSLRHLLNLMDPSVPVYPFRSGPLGNDEIAFEVPGVDIPCGSLMRAPFDQYHTQFDNADAVDEAFFEAYVSLVMRLINVLERNCVLKSKFKGLPQLSNPKLNLYISPAMLSHLSQSPLKDWAHLLKPVLEDKSTLSGLEKNPQRLNDLMTLVTPYARDGLSLLELAEETRLPFELVDAYTNLWVDRGLIEKVWIHPFH